MCFFVAWFAIFFPKKNKLTNKKVIQNEKNQTKANKSKQYKTIKLECYQQYVQSWIDAANTTNQGQ